MLQVARDLVTDQKLDVVVGLVETHRRHETASLVLGLELLPRRKVEYRGRVLDEFDLDAALARKPKLLLVDELAHTNAPGSRHPKRWQDIEEVLAAGIDVFTTMNVQHIESLNDVIAQITRVQVRETVPDSVIDKADAIELVDIAPEELLQRLKEGKVYLPEQARRAADHFFQRGNLLALRELALRRTAQHVDEDVREFREQQGVAATWPAGERILVCVGPAPSSGRLIRAAARMAAGLRCPWVAAYVEASGVGAMSEADRERLEVHLRVAESLGGTVTRLSGARVPEAILHYARRHNVTRIVIGKPTHSRFRDRLRGSLLDDIVRGSGDIDVHVISGDESGDAGARPGPTSAPRSPVRHYVGSAAIVLASMGVAALLRVTLQLPDLVMLFLLAVMIAAAWFGRGPALLAAALSVAAYDFFFVPPFHTFSVSDRNYFLTFAMMFGVSIAISELVGRLRRQEQDALGREERTAILYALTRDLASADEVEDVARAAATHAGEIFSARVAVLGFDALGGVQALSSSPNGWGLDPKDLGVAKWSYEHDQLAGLGTETLHGSRVLCAPLRISQSRLGVLALVPTGEFPFRSDQRAFLELFCKQTAAALERVRLSEEAKGATLRAQTEEMRASLLSAVSHDLRTPLATITGAATAVRDEDLPPDTRIDLVNSIVGEATRMERLIANLLDMTRLESGGVQLKRDWVPLDEIISSTLTRLEERLERRTVTVDIGAEVPLVLVDPVLFEQLFVNLLENADKYTPLNTPIEVRAHSDGQLVSIEVIDHGPGIPTGAEIKIFDKFFRGPHQGVSGAGLGLPICKGIVDAHGGTISAENRASGGAVFRVVLPKTEGPPSAAPDGATS
jgi:two-component system sensor histidine kinase KdpD